MYKSWLLENETVNGAAEMFGVKINEPQTKVLITVRRKGFR